MRGLITIIAILIIAGCGNKDVDIQLNGPQTSSSPSASPTGSPTTVASVAASPTVSPSPRL